MPFLYHGSNEKTKTFTAVFDRHFVVHLILIVTAVMSVAPTVTHCEEVGAYASAKYTRHNKILDIPPIRVIKPVSLRYCLSICIRNAKCQAFNYGNETCFLLPQSLCHNDTYKLTEKPGFNYYDILHTHYSKDGNLDGIYCTLKGKCGIHCYENIPIYFHRLVPKETAQSTCESIDRTLPMPKKRKDQDVYAALSRFFSGENMWIGLSDIETEGQWVFDDGTRIKTFSSWQNGEPNNFQDEDCVAMIADHGYKWFDKDCSLEMRFYCV